MWAVLISVNRDLLRDEVNGVPHELAEWGPPICKKTTERRRLQPMDHIPITQAIQVLQRLQEELIFDSPLSRRQNDIKSPNHCLFAVLNLSVWRKLDEDKFGPRPNTKDYILPNSGQVPSARWWAAASEVTP